jgi:hypothetical protein
MAKRANKGGFAAAMGSDGAKAVLEKRKQSVDYGQGNDAPAGIDNGVARINKCFIDQHKEGDNRGKWYYYQDAIVVAPKMHDGMPCEGTRVWNIEPLYETPSRTRKTPGDHLSWVMNEMKKLGVDMGESTVDDLPVIAKALEKQKPFTKFRTWKGEKQKTGPYAGREPRTQYDFQGAVNDYEMPEDEDDVKEEADVVEKEPVEEAPAEEELDLSELASRADENGDNDAVKILVDRALALGVQQDDINEALSWAEVAEMAEAAEEEKEANTDSEEEIDTPEEGDIFLYRPPRKRKAVECEVTKVFPKEQKCNLKNSDSGQIYKAVGWDSLAVE